MGTHIISKQCGDWVLTPGETPSPFSGDRWQSFQASSGVGTMDYQSRNTSQIQVQVFQLRISAPDLMTISTQLSPYTLLFQLTGSSVLRDCFADQHNFHERCCNLLYQGGPEYRFQFREAGTYLFVLIGIQEEFNRSLDQKIPLQRNYHSLLTPQNIIIDKSMLDLLSDILFQKSRPGWADYVFDESVRMLTHLILGKKDHGPFQSFRLNKSDSDWFQKMKLQLLEVKNQPLAFQELLRKAKLVQVKRFRKLLRAFYGLTIQELITEARMTEAKTLLSTTDLTIKQVTGAVGYKNIFYFSKIFKQYTGIPPAAFQRRNAK